MARKAVCIGINNYPGVDADLSGCINDANDWSAVLQERGFDVKQLTNRSATKKKMVAALSELLVALKQDDIGVITYSGHGTWVPDLDGDEPDGRDEGLCPFDMSETNLLLDDELRDLLTRRNPHSTIVLITDSCHSGTVFRLAGTPGKAKRMRYLPPSNFIRDPRMLARVATLTHQRPDASDKALPGVIHMAACSDRDYSYDASFDDRPNGAFTYYALQALKQSPQMTYNEWMQKIKLQLPSWEYPQKPRLNAPAALKRTQVFA